jgi:F0F1-type ATP synthase membrane subunit b/b'
MTSKKFAIALSCLLLSAGAAGAAPQGGPHRPQHRLARPFVERFHQRARPELPDAGFLARARARIEARREEIAKRVISRLGVTEAQRSAFRTQAEAAKPVVERARAEIRRVLEQARQRARAGDPREAREWARGEIRSVIEGTYPQIEPNARQVVEQLSPEQRARLDGIAKLRGKRFDDERLKRCTAWLLARRSRDHGPARPSTPRY